MAIVGDKPWRELLGRLRRASGKRVRVGVLDGQIARIAKYHEYGAPGAGIPERSFIRATLQDRRDELAAVQARLTSLVIADKLTESKALEILGAWAAHAMRQRILDQKGFAPLAPSTLREKLSRGRDKILIDTGQLIASIVWKLV